VCSVRFMGRDNEPQDASCRFAALSRAYSRYPSVAPGGNLGQIALGHATPEFKRVLMRFAAGEIRTEPVATVLMRAPGIWRASARC